MYLKCFSVFLLYLVNSGDGLVIPEELPSLLSVAYSNIPPIKKGTDSRVGFGFALGNHADFQVTFELGPQTNTAPIGSSFAANSKRQVKPTSPPRRAPPLKATDPASYLQSWAQSMRTGGGPLQQTPFQPLPIPGAPALTSAQGPVSLEDSLVQIETNSKGEFEIKQPPPTNMHPKVLDHLKTLYGVKDEAHASREHTSHSEKVQELEDIDNLTVKNHLDRRSPDQVKKITEDLSNVDLD